MLAVATAPAWSWETTPLPFSRVREYGAHHKRRHPNQQGTAASRPHGVDDALTVLVERQRMVGLRKALFEAFCAGDSAAVQGGTH